MRDILEKPRGELIGCVIPTPIEVNRTFGNGEWLQWQGPEFTIHHTPGHADYHMGMFGNIDGHFIAFSGDNIFPLSDSTPSLIYRNHAHKTSPPGDGPAVSRIHAGNPMHRSQLAARGQAGRAPGVRAQGARVDAALRDISAR